MWLEIGIILRIIANALGEDRWAKSHIFVIAVERSPTR
jgi:hypothetical protein